MKRSLQLSELSLHPGEQCSLNMVAGKGEVLVVAATDSSRKIAQNLAAAPIPSMQHPIPNIEFHFKYNGVAIVSPCLG